AAGKAHGCVADGEEPPGRLLGEDGPSPLLDELHEPVRRIEPELHSRHPKRTYVRWQDLLYNPATGSRTARTTRRPTSPSGWATAAFCIRPNGRASTGSSRSSNPLICGRKGAG